MSARVYCDCSAPSKGRKSICALPYAPVSDRESSAEIRTMYLPRTVMYSCSYLWGRCFSCSALPVVRGTMYLPILIPSVCVGALLSLVFLAYSCWKTFHWSPQSRCGRERPVDPHMTANAENPDLQRHICSFGWQDLQVTLRGGVRRVILHASCGRTSSRELTAIIGPSGVL